MLGGRGQVEDSPWRGEDADTSVPLDTLDQRTVFIYSDSWQILEERIDVTWTPGSPPSSFTPEKVYQNIYGLEYIDQVHCRRLDGNADGTYGLTLGDKTYYHLTDDQFSTLAVLDQNANLIERIDYDPYGMGRAAFNSGTCFN